MSEFNRLVGGGLLPSSAYSVEAEPGTGELAFMATFFNQGLQEADICGVLDYYVAHAQINNRLTSFGVDMKKAMDSGSLIVADLRTNLFRDLSRLVPSTLLFSATGS